MMKTKDILAMALLPALGVLTACSNDDAQTADRVPITLTGTTMTVEETRAAADTALNKGYLESEQTVKVLVRNTNGTDDDWKDYIYTSAANGVLTPPSTPPFYPLDNTNVDIVAFSPSFASSTFSVLSDQTTNDSYMASDLVYASVTNKAKSTTAVPLQFEHKMAKIVVNVTAGKGVSEIRSVTLASIYPTVSFNESTGAIGSATGTKTPVTIISGNETPAASGAAVIPGQTVVGNLLTVVTDLGTATYSVSSKTFTAGNAYTLNIRVKQTDINATTAIKDWTDNSTVNIGMVETSKQFELNLHGRSAKFRMVYVQGGDYTTFRGKEVTGTLSDYYILQIEVTNNQWYCVMGSTPTGQDYNGDGYPVACVSWNDIVNEGGFLEQLNTALADKIGSMRFKLPTEAQWEYAAHGGVLGRGYMYSGSNTLAAVAWYGGNSGNKTNPVGQLGANELGLYDMTGNVQEWCSDWYSSTVTTVQGKDYTGPASGTEKVARGRQCKITGDELKISSEDNVRNLAPTTRGAATGFRLVLQ
jgi:formylglycine-generating enzyme required for sulfatase activity